MSGPALRKADSHAAIHEAALLEARELTNITSNLLKENDLKRALEAAYITVEHWESRTLNHADAEEKGLYKEFKKDPDFEEVIIALTRDHDLLRLLVNDIKENLGKNGINETIINQLQALIIINGFHNRAEEKMLPKH